jgi:o-succinylbenzoate---CoA ligase
MNADSPYPYSHIWINGRNVSLFEIVEDRSPAYSEFEYSTFSFIREWRGEEQYFSTNTSGSTGAPKKITFHRKQMIESARLTEKALELKSGYNALVCLDTKYIAGKMMIVRSFVTGMKIIALDPCANPLIKIPIDVHIDFAALVPYQVTAALESKHPHLLNNLLTVIIGGAPLHEFIKQQLKAFSCRCYLTYGMTETLSHIALQQIHNNDNSDNYFQALPGVSISMDYRGCAVIKAAHLGEPIVTNDLIEIVGDGNEEFIWLGRWDNVINTGGVKVFPEKIEASIARLFEDLNLHFSFFIYGIADETWGSKVILVVEDIAPDQEKYKKLTQRIYQTIPAIQRPKELWISSSFHRTETGKINRLQTLKNVSLNITISK